MTDPIFGISINRTDDQALPAVTADMAVVGLVGTAPGANAQTFPLDTPVLIFSDDATTMTALGTTGSLPDQITLINEQLGDFQVASRIVIVRVEEGADEAATIANLVGDPALKTGMYALRLAGPQLGVVPRLIGVPGYTHQRDTGVATLVIATPGTGYAVNDPITGTGGGGTGFAGKVSAVDGTGAITGVTITSGGSGYTGVPNLTITSAEGANGNITATIADLANAVCANLPALCSALLAHAVVSGPHSTLTAFTDWRETLDSERLIPVETWVKGGTLGTEMDSVGAILGLFVRRDHENNGRPFKSVANQPIYGILAPNRYIEFSLDDGATEGQQILAGNGGVILRGEAGVETAIASGGFIFVGTDNAGSDDLWRFYNVTRGRDYMHLRFLITARGYLGKYNITGQTIQAIINTAKSEFRDLQADGDILGYNVTFERDQNSPDNLRLGRFKLTFQAEEAPVLRYIGVNSGRYLPALDALLDDLTSQLATAT